MEAIDKGHLKKLRDSGYITEYQFLEILEKARTKNTKTEPLINCEDKTVEELVCYLHERYPQVDKQHLMFTVKHGEAMKLGGPSYFTLGESMQIVCNMHHTCKGVLEKGEKYSLDKTIQVYEKFKEELKKVSYLELYVALNAQYHDYANLYHHWFGEDICEKICLSTINFWFADEDYDGCKIYNYFMKR